MKMTKFKVLEYNQLVLNVLGISVATSNEFFKSIQTYYVLSCAIFLNMISCGAFAIKNWHQHFGVSLEALSLFIAGYQYGGMFLSIGLKIDLMKKLQGQLQETVDKCA